MNSQRNKPLLTLLFGILILTLFYCNSKQTNEASLEESNPKDSLLHSNVGENKTSLPRNGIIKYFGASSDENKLALETFPPFSSVSMLASKAIGIKDSLEYLRGNPLPSDPKDSAVIAPYITKAYQAILEYKTKLAEGKPVAIQCPTLLQLTRNVSTGDSSSKYLPNPGKSDFLASGKFFLLGGAPFISKINPDDEATFIDPNGNPEVRFTSNITENGNYLFNSIYHFKYTPMEVSFGPPLDSYESGPQEINNIGSLIHTYSNRIPVFFITENGFVPAHLLSITLKLVPENLGCVSDQPRLEFACSKMIDESEILGIYISFSNNLPVSCTINHLPNSVWTVDFDNDGIPEVACVSGTFEGIMSDAMAEVLWFVNINGVWEIIDWGQELDCT